MIVVFLGPTLGIDEARALLPEATFHPPVAQGDVWRAALQQPHAIGIVDGYFERLPAVWHKEILWAMTRGVHVYGAASMGALRAAELDGYGMVGVGAIYEGYRSGALERDDEVAITHAEAAAGYKRLSVALADIRATVRAAVEAGVVSASDAGAVLDAAERRHYSERRWPLILADATVRCKSGDLEPFVHWLPHGERSQKADDARAMLTLMRQQLAENVAPLSVGYEFEHTYFWNEACRQNGRGETVAQPNPIEGVLDELRLLGENRYEAAMAAAAARLLALEWASDRGFSPSPEQTDAAWEDIVVRFGLEDPNARRMWIDQQGLESNDLVQWMQREATYAHLLRTREGALPSHLVDALRASGEYGELLERASAKRVGYEPDAEDRHVSEHLRRYYAVRLGLPVPTALAATARRLGLADEHVWLRVLGREFAFAERTRSQRGKG